VAAGHGQGQIPDVGPLQDYDPWIGPDPGVQLPVTDVYGYDVARAPLQQAVAKPSGRGSGIQGRAAGNRNREVLDSCIEFLTAPADKPGGWSRQHDRLGRTDQPSRLGGRRPIDEDTAVVDGRLCRAPSGDEASADQLGVEPAPTGQG
jgi:hypothetical protein